MKRVPFATPPPHGFSAVISINYEGPAVKFINYAAMPLSRTSLINVKLLSKLSRRMSQFLVKFPCKGNKANNALGTILRADTVWKSKYILYTHS
jgi:hypothetical protein